LLCWLPEKKDDKFSNLYESIIALISSVRPGCSVAVIISSSPEETIKEMARHTESEES